MPEALPCVASVNPRTQIRLTLGVSRRAGSSSPVRVLSIGAGPAQELHELFQEVDDLPASLEVVLFEQDKNALAHAFRRLTPSVDARFPGRVRLLFLHDSIKRLLRDGSLFAPFGKFDLIYSTGLLDYLQHRTGIVLTRHLANAAAPGGQLLVANMVDHASRTLLQFHLDWPLIYRTREELLDVALEGEGAAGPGALGEVDQEDPGRHHVALVGLAGQDEGLGDLLEAVEPERRDDGADRAHDHDEDRGQVDQDRGADPLQDEGDDDRDDDDEPGGAICGCVGR